MAETYGVVIKIVLLVVLECERVDSAVTTETSGGIS